MDPQKLDFEIKQGRSRHGGRIVFVRLPKEWRWKFYFTLYDDEELIEVLDFGDGRDPSKVKKVVKIEGEGTCIFNANLEQVLDLD